MADFIGCDWQSAYLLIFSENVDQLTYYSHLLPLIASLILGIIVLLNNPRALINRALFFMTGMFSLWVYFDLILWASPSPEAVMFFWSIIVPVEMLLYASTLYLVSLFANGRHDTSIIGKVLVGILFVPIVIFTHTPFNVVGLSPDCDEGAIEGPLIEYMYYIEFGIILLAIFTIIRGYRRLSSKTERQQLLWVGLGAVVFMVSFSAGNLTLLFSLDPAYEQYKLFGMPIFVCLLTYSIIKFRAFNVKLLTAQAVVIALAVLVLSILFVPSLSSVRLISGISFILVCTLGYVLIRNVQREIEQRQHIEELAKNLAVANARLRELDKQKSEFVSIASHQLRSPLTAMTGYSSLMIDGTFGALTPDLREAAVRIFESGKTMAVAIDDFLNVTRIEQGRMIYTFEQFMIHDLIKQCVAEMHFIAERKGLDLQYEGTASSISITADKGKVKQIITNLLDNAIKYTKKGEVNLHASADATMLTIQVRDTGIGLSAEDKTKLFQKFSRAQNANEVSVRGTGLGLYIAIEMARAMGGDITVDSPGRGSGSTFTFSVPIRASKPVEAVL